MVLRHTCSSNRFKGKDKVFPYNYSIVPKSVHKDYGIWVSLVAAPLFIGTYLIFIGLKLDEVYLTIRWVTLFIPLWIAMIILSVLSIIYLVLCVKKRLLMIAIVILLGLISGWTFLILYPLALDHSISVQYAYSYIPFYISSSMCITLYILNIFKPITS